MSAIRCKGCGKTYVNDLGYRRHSGGCKRLNENGKRLVQKLQSTHKSTAGSKRPFGLASWSREVRSMFSREVKRPRRDAAEDTVQEPAQRDHELELPHLHPAHTSPSVEEEPTPSPPPPEQLPPTPLPAKRPRKLTAKLREMLGITDELPQCPGPLFEYINAPEPPPASPEPAPVDEPALPSRCDYRKLFKTFTSRFRITRTYRGRPSGVPDLDTRFERFLSDTIHLCRARTTKPEPPPPRTVSEIIYPYPNISAFYVNDYTTESGKKGNHDRECLLANVLRREGFNAQDVQEPINFKALDKKVLEYYNKDVGDESLQRGWKKSTVHIKIPTGVKETKAVKKKKAANQRRMKRDAADNHRGEDEPGVSSSMPGKVHHFPIRNFWHRSLLSVIQEACSSTEPTDFHWHPYENTWVPPWDGATTEHIHGELYTSPAFLEADQELQTSPGEPGCNLPRCVAAMMVYSDATQVAQFGQASLWPVYVYFGNQSKYERGRPGSQMAYNVAFLPSLPDEIADYVFKVTGKHATSALLTHCKRELYHACFGMLYDDDFLAAYEHGIVVECSDGVRRRMYPRIFIHSADYKEKVLIVTIKDFGLCACARCKIPTEDFWKAGMPSDMKARTDLVRRDDEERRRKVKDALQLVYQKGYVVDSTHVDDLLKDESLVPTMNVYSNQVFLDHGMDVFKLAAIDLMHEVELGVWKMLLQHLIRILYCQETSVIHAFNSRFRRISPFGADTLRKFKNNVSDLKQLAARDYEDILQCIIPCIEGLLPNPFNETILDLLYAMAYFHSLAKLRMHTDSSLQVLTAVITSLCDALRFFAQETCEHFDTVETEKEYRARQRRVAAYNVKNSASAAVGGKKKKKFSLITTKFHALPDYPEHIARLGTTDCYTTRRGETRHRLIKNLYQRTNKNNPVPQIVKLDNLTAIHAHMRNELKAAKRFWSQKEKAQPNASHGVNLSEAVDSKQLKQQYMVACSRKSALIIPLWLQQHYGDPAVKDFLPRLKAYILAHMGVTSLGNSLGEGVKIKDHTMYTHATATFHYTAYDLRRERESISMDKKVDGELVRCDVMVPSFNPDDPHPYSYARVLGVYHAEVYSKGATKPERVEFLWVRWFQRSQTWLAGPSHLRLDRIGFIPQTDPDAFGFIHPSSVIRACHLIPAFQEGRTVELLNPSLARNREGDWVSYYVNRFVDRDMMMRYLGLGVGHCYPAAFPRENKQLLMLPASNPNYTVTLHDTGPENEEPPDEVDQWFMEQTEAVDDSSEDGEGLSDDEDFTL